MRENKKKEIICSSIHLVCLFSLLRVHRVSSCISKKGGSLSNKHFNTTLFSHLQHVSKERHYLALNWWSDAIIEHSCWQVLITISVPYTSSTLAYNASGCLSQPPDFQVKVKVVCYTGHTKRDPHKKIVF